MDLYDVAVARKLSSGGGGGGGSSDFSTAEVTVTNSTGAGLELPLAVIEDDATLGSIYLDINDTVDKSAVLYKNKAIASIPMFKTAIVTGNATVDPIIGAVLITGDCTITIS